MNLGKPIGVRLEPKIEKSLRNEAARREINVTELIREIIGNDQRYIQDFSLINNEIHALRDLMANEEWVDSVMSIQIELLLTLREVVAQSKKDSVEGLMTLMGVEQFKVDI